MQDYDQQLAEFIREDIGKQLSIMRFKAVRRARAHTGIDIGNAAKAVYRRTYREQLGGNINIAGNRRKMETAKRPWQPGQKVHRDILDRTRKINQYYGMDRAFILRILEVGRDSFEAQSGTGAKGQGSKATWGRRGAIAARGFFHTMAPDMERAAETLGQDISKFCENLMERK